VVGQVGFVVPDAAAAARTAESLLGAGPFSSFEIDANEFPTYVHRGEKATWTIRVALNSATPQLEFIESVTGPNVYDEAIAARGYGLHHLGFYVDDVDAVTAAMSRHGVSVLQSGSTPDGAFAYYDTEALLGYLVEAIWLSPDSPFAG
jgi:methylmalonyl-CoA/ethylmalonyl-CoA epimerase